MTDALRVPMPNDGRIIPLPPYDAEHLEALGKRFCDKLNVPNEWFEDAVQEFVLGGLTGMKRKDFLSGSVRAYQYKCAENHVKAYLKRENAFRSRNPKSLQYLIKHDGDAVEYGNLIADEEANDPLELILKKEQGEILQAALDEMSETDRSLLTLKYLEKWSYKRLGQHFQMSHETARSRISDIVETLRIKLGEYFEEN